MKKLYPWIESTYLKILASFKKEKGHHALLLHSKKGNGEILLIKSIIQWLMCNNKNEINNCGNCHSCQLMKVDNHPDYYKLELKKGENRLGVERIRYIINNIYNRSNQDGVKIVFLSNIEQFTEQSINALLKILEEPPSETYFFLVCQEPKMLISTLVSRCIYWFLPSPSEELGINWLETYGEIRDLLSAKTALRLSEGAPIAAHNLLQPLLWKDRIEFCSLLKKAMNIKNFLILLPLLKRHKDDTSTALYWLISLLIDSLKLKHSSSIKEILINLDQYQLIIELAEYHSLFILHHQIQQWMLCFRQFNTIPGINKDILLVQRLLSWEDSTINNKKLYSIL